MVEAKIVAARTQRCWRTVHVAPRAARMASASHGLARPAIMPLSWKPSAPLLSDLLSAASARERKEPVAKQREGEVVFRTIEIDSLQASRPPHPPLASARPLPLPPRSRPPIH